MTKPSSSKKNPEAIRKRRQLQQKHRKRLRKKEQSRKPSWVEALKKKYSEEGKEFGAEVQEDIDEERQAQLNKKQPLETQLFMKGLPIDSDPEQLKQYFSRFGEVRRVLLVKDTVTKAPNGCGFVHFANVRAATAAFDSAARNATEATTQESEELKAEGLSRRQEKKLEFGLNKKTAKRHDPFIEVNGSRVVVHTVLSRTDAIENSNTLKAAKKKGVTCIAANDPRNLYLLQEGLIEEGSAAARGLPKPYLAMLADDYENRKQQLRNVNTFVSKTRLSFRNIPRNITEKELRALCLDKVRDLTKAAGVKLDRAQWGKYGPIRNLKILVDGNGVSRGFGFVEFVSHDLALHVLRQLNNNPNIYGAHRRLVVSFAIENVNALQKLERLRENRKRKLSTSKETDEQDDGNGV